MNMRWLRRLELGQGRGRHASNAAPHDFDRAVRQVDRDGSQTAQRMRLAVIEGMCAHKDAIRFPFLTNQDSFHEGLLFASHGQALTARLCRVLAHRNRSHFSMPTTA